MRSQCTHLSYQAFVLVLLTIPAVTLLNSCQESDANLASLQLRATCSLSSKASPSCAQLPGIQHDWPNQVVYWQQLLDAIVAPDTCLNTTKAHGIINWTSSSQSNTSIAGSFADTWLNFQVQYYDMPRKPNVRIEAPDTLGRKCWAFAYLDRFWNGSAVAKAGATAGTSTRQLAAMYQTGLPLTMGLCRKVEENCFVNQTYDPSRNGTCALKLDAFHYLGFERENLLRRNILHYPFY
eukprot:m.63837 g.63837  ORF g.63837 m.63837 type:complete len:237 (+) comp13981_c0_seq2:47-757(+)